MSTEETAGQRAEQQREVLYRVRSLETANLPFIISTHTTGEDLLVNQKLLL